MRKQNYIIISLIMFAISSLAGQQQTIIVPQNYEEALHGTRQIAVDLRQYPYENNKIDVREMKRLYPGLKVKDHVIIRPPDLSNFQSTTTLMTVAKDPKSEDLELIIWLAGDYNTLDVTFFIDTYSSRDFSDAKQIKLKAGGKAKTAYIYPFGTDAREATEMLVRVPKLPGTDLEEFIKQRKYKKRIRSNFAIGAFAGFGSGKIHHDYTSTLTNFPGWYDVVLSEKLVGISISKYFQRFKIEAKGTYQNIFQYTSYFKLRYGEPEITFSSTGVRNVNENLRVETNQDRHTKHRFKAGLQIAPRFNLSPLMEIQPTIGAGYIFFRDEPYFANKFEGHIRSFEQEPTQFLEFGVNVEMTIGNEQSLSIGFFYNLIDWEPVGYFDTIEGVNLNNYYRGYNMSVAYTFGL